MSLEGPDGSLSLVRMMLVAEQRVHGSGLSSPLALSGLVRLVCFVVPQVHLVLLMNSPCLVLLFLEGGAFNQSHSAGRIRIRGEHCWPKAQAILEPVVPRRCPDYSCRLSWGFLALLIHFSHPVLYCSKNTSLC
jgi:hypothetical protein